MTYIDGKAKNMHKAKREAAIRGNDTRANPPDSALFKATWDWYAERRAVSEAVTGIDCARVWCYRATNHRRTINSVARGLIWETAAWKRLGTA